MVGNTKQVDIIRDVGNLGRFASKACFKVLTPAAFARFAASMFAIPLKTEMTPNAIFTEHEVYGMLTVGTRHSDLRIR